MTRGIRYALIVAGLAFGWLGWTVWATFGDLGAGGAGADQPGRQGGARVTSTPDEPLAAEPEDETLVQRAFVLAYQALGRASRAMPEKTGRAVATRIGASVLPAVARTRGTVVAANQAQVLGRPVDDPLVVASTREAFELYARYFVRLVPPAGAERRGDRGAGRVRHASTGSTTRLAAGKGVICALPHLGNWDAAGTMDEGDRAPGARRRRGAEAPAPVRPVRRAPRVDRDGRRRPLGPQRRRASSRPRSARIG